MSHDLELEKNNMYPRVRIMTPEIVGNAAPLGDGVENKDFEEAIRTMARVCRSEMKLGDTCKISAYIVSAIITAS